MKHRTPRRRPKKLRTKKKAAAPERQRKFIRHSLFGEIPLAERTIVGQDGIARKYLDYDPTYQPPLPRGAVRGNILQQVFCSACHVPKYFYVDETRHCIQCGENFLFSAREQKYWYENLKFNFYSDAIRCPACRRQQRSEKAVQRQLEAASAKVRAHPEDPLALLSYSEAAVLHQEMFQRADLDKAISCARRAKRLSPQLHECLFWEARCHQLARRTAKAAKLYQEFVEAASGIKRCRALVSRARQALDIC